MIENLVADFTNVLNELSNAKAKAKFHKLRAERAAWRRSEHRMMLINEKMQIVSADFRRACTDTSAAMTAFADAYRNYGKKRAENSSP